jgi:hypothetical protein
MKVCDYTLKFKDDMRNAYKIFIGKSEGKRPCGRSRRRWEDNIRNGSYGDTTGRGGLDASGSG